MVTAHGNAARRDPLLWNVDASEYEVRRDERRRAHLNAEVGGKVAIDVTLEEAALSRPGPRHSAVRLTE
jgi:hypothetical protein